MEARWQPRLAVMSVWADVHVPYFLIQWEQPNCNVKDIQPPKGIFQETQRPQCNGCFPLLPTPPYLSPCLWAVHGYPILTCNLVSCVRGIRTIWKGNSACICSSRRPSGASQRLPRLRLTLFLFSWSLVLHVTWSAWFFHAQTSQFSSLAFPTLSFEA